MPRHIAILLLALLVAGLVPHLSHTVAENANDGEYGELELIGTYNITATGSTSTWHLVSSVNATGKYMVVVTGVFNEDFNIFFSQRSDSAMPYSFGILYYPGPPQIMFRRLYGGSPHDAVGLYLPSGMASFNASFIIDTDIQIIKAYIENTDTGSSSEIYSTFGDYKKWDDYDKLYIIYNGNVNATIKIYRIIENNNNITVTQTVTVTETTTETVTQTINNTLTLTNTVTSVETLTVNNTITRYVPYYSGGSSIYLAAVVVFVIIMVLVGIAVSAGRGRGR